MTATRRIFVSLGSFGASEVRRRGQGPYIGLCREAGADGVEIRGELLAGHEGELAALARSVGDTGMACVYSSPGMLWNGGGGLAMDELDQGLERAAALGAQTLKMSIGGFGPESRGCLDRLAQRLAQRDARGIALLIENDQTGAAGSLGALRAFFGCADRAGLTLGMTFDMGNWHWNGECPLQAAEAFSARVRYVHCKGVQRQPAKWVAVPLEQSAAPWRAVLRAMPRSAPRAIEYPLAGDDLLGLTRRAVRQLRILESDT